MTTKNNRSQPPGSKPNAAAFGQQRLFTVLALSGLCLAGCTKLQPTPEPANSDAFYDVRDKLDGRQFFNWRSGEMSAEPDASVFESWGSRRRATLAHALRINQFPAPSNPGRVFQTLNWERDAMRRDGSESELNRYKDARYGWKERCPQTSRVENVWFEKELKAWGGGERTALTDLAAAKAKHEAQCKVEEAALHRTQDAQNEIAAAAENVARLEAEAVEAHRQQIQAKADACNVEYGRAETERERLVLEERVDARRSMALNEQRYNANRERFERCLSAAQGG